RALAAALMALGSPRSRRFQKSHSPASSARRVAGRRSARRPAGPVQWPAPRRTLLTPRPATTRGFWGGRTWPVSSALYFSPSPSVAGDASQPNSTSRGGSCLPDLFWAAHQQKAMTAGQQPRFRDDSPSRIRPGSEVSLPGQRVPPVYSEFENAGSASLTRL